MTAKGMFCSQIKMIVISVGLLFIVLSFPKSSKGEDSMQTAADTKKIVEERLNSMQQLRKLGDAIAIYADSHEGKYPNKLEEFTSYRGIDLVWLMNNVCYIGANMTRETSQDKPIAFDKTMLSKGNGTVVLYNDKHVEFVKPDKLETLGIPQICQEPTAKKQENNAGPIVLKVVGPDGKILADANVYQYFSMQDGRRQGIEYACDKNGLAALAEEKIFKYDWQRKGVVLYGLYESNLAGFIDVNADDLGKEMEMKLTPACRVYGKIKSRELDTLGQKLDWSNVYVYFNNQQPLSYMGQKGDFEFLMPDGKYQLYAYGMSAYGKLEQVEIKPGQKELELNFDLPADRLANLVGKEAPELQKMKGWLNSKPLSLKELRGKVVLLDFWGTWCGPCVQAIPDLIDLSEKYHDKGLVIIGIHDDSMNSVKDLEKEIDKLSKERWDGKKIPFAIALDGGGRCKIEGTNLTSSGATTAAYGIQKWPTMVLIDKKGKIVKEYNRGGDTEVMEKLLAAEVNDTP